MKLELDIKQETIEKIKQIATAEKGNINATIETLVDLFFTISQNYEIEQMKLDNIFNLQYNENNSVAVFYNKETGEYEKYEDGLF